MLSAKRFGKPIEPIIAHAGIHAVLMLAVVYAFVDFRAGAIAFVVQLFTHALIDIGKGRLNALAPSLQSPANKYHWYVFGFDQLLHGLVIILIVAICY
jgi:hypothetical protein